MIHGLWSGRTAEVPVELVKTAGAQPFPHGPGFLLQPRGLDAVLPPWVPEAAVRPADRGTERLLSLHLLGPRVPACRRTFGKEHPPVDQGVRCPRPIPPAEQPRGDPPKDFTPKLVRAAHAEEAHSDSSRSLLSPGRLQEGTSQGLALHYMVSVSLSLFNSFNYNSRKERV